MSNPTPAVDAAKAPPQKSKKLLFIALGTVLLLGGGGTAAFLLLKPTPGHARAQVAAKHVESLYVALDPPFVVNFESNELVRFLQVTVQAMTTDPAAAELIKKHDPVIRNALLMLFSGQSYDTLRSAAGKEALRQSALAEVRKVVAAEGGKPDAVRSLYFTSFVMQ